MFNQRFATRSTRAAYRKTMALLFLDLDRFKSSTIRSAPVRRPPAAGGCARLRMCLREAIPSPVSAATNFVALIETSASRDVISVAQENPPCLRWPFMLQGETCHLSASIEEPVTRTTARTSRIC